jgi:DNA-binding response OmpR family regulator
MNQRSEKILIVDDDAEIRAILEAFLKRNSFSVISAVNGKNAMDLLLGADNIPDLIICDIVMPEVDGYSFFKGFSGYPRLAGIPFIFLSGKSSAKEVRFGKFLGADDYLTKPFKPADLLAVIEGKLGRKRQSLELARKISNNLLKYSVSDGKQKDQYLFHVIWDMKTGAKTKKSYPHDTNIATFDDLGNQLFALASVIFGPRLEVEPDGVLLNLDTINRNAYVYFDSTAYKAAPSRSDIFMLVYLSEAISYLDSIKIKAIFKQTSAIIKKGRDWDAEATFMKITNESTLEY